MTRPNGRGRGWNKVPVLRRDARRIARYNAGLIIEAVVSDGWEDDDLLAKYGTDGLAVITKELLNIALRLRETGDPDGKVNP